MDRPHAGTHYPRSMGDLQAWFRTDADCLDYLEWLRWPAGFVCADCSHDSGWRLGDGRYRCSGCGGAHCRTARRSPRVSLTAFAAHLPDLQPWPLMDMDFAISCPLVRPSLPRIRFLFVRSRFCSTLPPDPASRRRPCASLALRFHQAVQRTFTSKLSDMPGTQRSR